jgi:chitodextrinase
LSSLIDLARKLRPYIEKTAITLDDSDALEATQLFPIWRADATYEKDDRVRYDTILYKCLQNHIAQEAWTPTAAPSLWAKVLIPSPDVIPEWEQPDSTNPYQIGDKVRFEGKVYESVIANNIWSPRDYPQGWHEVT